MRRSGLFWGAILILAGVVLLLDNLDLLPPNVNIWGIFWPLLLIGFGLWTLWGVLGPRRAAAEEHVTIPLEGASRAHIRVNHGAGRLDIRAGAGANEILAGRFSGGLDYQAQRAGDELEVSLRAPAGTFPWVWGPRGALDWSIGLNRDIPLALEVQAGANDARLDLSDLRISDLRLETGASSTEITLPAHAGHTRARIEAGAASVTVHVPDQAAARLRIEGALVGTNVDTRRFPRQGEFYQSPDYDAASNRVELTIEAGAGSIRVY